MNTYEDERRANAYADLERVGTYYLAFRDLPDILSRHVNGKMALDFGCGAGRSTRFLKQLGFDVLGVDISDPMLSRARERDVGGRYQRINDADFSALEEKRFDLVLCAFTFDNIPMYQKRLNLYEGLGRLLAEGGRIVNLVSAAELYLHEWVSFSTHEFPENRQASTGDTVRLVMLDVRDRRPVEDVFWPEADYRTLFEAAQLQLLETHRPLGNKNDPYQWITETSVSPWAIHVLSRPSG